MLRKRTHLASLWSNRLSYFFTHGNADSDFNSPRIFQTSPMVKGLEACGPDAHGARVGRERHICHLIEMEVEKYDRGLAFGEERLP